MPNWLFSWTLISILVFAVNFAALSLSWLDYLDNTLKPDGQKLATTCYVDKQITKNKIAPEEKYDGYFYGEVRNLFSYSSSHEKTKINCFKSQESPTDIEVKFEACGIGGCYFKTKWIPKKDFHKYYTLEELSEKVNKTK